MEKSDIELKNLILKFLAEKGSSQLSSGVHKKMVKQPKDTHEIMHYSTHNIVLLEKLLEDTSNDGYIDELGGTKETRSWQINTQGLHFYRIEGGYKDLIENNDYYTQMEVNDILSAIDELGVRLSKLELGMQITYDDLMDEFEDLKSKVHLLYRKSFGQLLKGKLIDLGLGKISKEVMHQIIDLFRGHNLIGM